jgi:TPP-dependent trihydroxycyclohexane-1,2-dione (THcHDO) dehydratase
VIPAETAVMQYPLQLFEHADVFAGDDADPVLQAHSSTKRIANTATL